MEFLAKQTGYSPENLSRKFWEELGDSLKAYIHTSKFNMPSCF